MRFWRRRRNPAARVDLARRERDPARLLRLLDDPVPGVRRAAAARLGALAEPAAAEALLRAARRERCEEPLVAMAVAAARCGAEAAAARAVLEAAERRTWPTPGGRRGAAGALGRPPRDEPLARWREAMGGGDAVRPSQEVRAAMRARLERDPEDADALWCLAAQQHPDDRALVARAARGRRGAHVRVRALGLHGDPAALRPLLRTLRAVDVDPGAGFAQRHLAALAVGRLGLPGAAGALLHALVVEAREHEGRPGAGMGVQRPVRAALVHALGECGERAAARHLVALLSDTSGTPAGGLYLPAMEALWRLGDPAPLRAALAGPDELAAAHALAVLAAVEGPEAACAALDDPRAPVAAVARAITACPTPPSSPP